MNASFAQENAIEKYFSQYLDDDDLTNVFISGKMFELMSNLDTEGDDSEDFKSVLSELTGLQILVANKNVKKHYNRFKSTIENGTYEILMKVRDEGDDVNMLVKENVNTDKIKELIMLVGGDSSFVFMSLMGHMSMESISKISESLDIDGSEHLNKLKDKND